VTRSEFLTFIESKQAGAPSFPIAIIRSQDLAALESIVKYMRENQQRSYQEIGSLLMRDPKSLAVSYGAAKRKAPDLFTKQMLADNLRIPFSIFSKKQPVLESICLYLQKCGNSNAKIAQMLGKDPSTIWTTLARAKQRSGTGKR
jgi:hypothetical protein